MNKNMSINITQIFKLPQVAAWGILAADWRR